MLSTFSLTEKAGYLAFRANPDLSRLVNFLKPPLYGRYRLLQVQALKATYSRKLFWFVMEDLGRTHGEQEPDEHVTEPCKVDWLKEYLGVTKFPRYQEFKFFRSEVLTPALADISQQSGYVAEALLHRVGRSVDSVSFKLARNGQLPLGLSTASEREVLVADVRAFGISASVCGKWLETFPLRDVQVMWDYVKGMHEKEPKANLAGYMTACLRNKGILTNLHQKTKRLEAQTELTAIQDKMRSIRERCMADCVAETKAGWLALSDDERVSLWQSLPSVQSRRVPMWCDMGVRSSSLERFLVDEKFVGEICDLGRPVEMFFSEFKTAMARRFGAEWPKLEALLAANGLDVLRERAAALEKT